MNVRRSAEERAALAAQIIELRQRGAFFIDIAQMLGISRSYANQLFHDPDLSKERIRKLKYQVPCEVCGGLTNPSGEIKEHYICARCAPSFYPKRIKWPKELLIERIQEWNTLYGSPPSMTDWNPWAAENDLYDLPRRDRWLNANGYWPWFTIVVRLFGTWSKGIEAAGLTPRRSGGYSENHRRRRDFTGTF